MNKTISVIMRSKNDAALIRDTLTMLFKQTITDFELINVDSGSTDGTVEIIKEFKTTLHQIEPRDYIPGKVLNDMIGIAKGEIIVFLNSDATPRDELWLENLLKALDNEKTAVAFSRQLARSDAYELVRFDYLRGYPPQVSPRMAPDFISFAAAALKRNIWNEIKFYEKGLAEDQAWAKLLVDKGYIVQYAPQSRVIHSHNLTIKELYRKEYLQGGVARVYIYRDSPALLKEIYQLVRSLGRDIIYSLKKGNLASIPYSFILRTTQHLAFYLGRRAGWKRVKSLTGKETEDATVHLLRKYTT